MTSKAPSPDICIVGGGLSGLATAFYLQQQPELRHANIRMIEARQRLGGSYVNTAHANVGVLHELLQENPRTKPQGPIDVAKEANTSVPPHDFRSLARQAVQEHLQLRHKSVTAAALQRIGTHRSSIEANGGNSHSSTGTEEQSISMEFGAGVPHILSPGGGHVLRLIQHLLMPSQLVIARRQAACLFSITRNTLPGFRSWLPFQRLSAFGQENKTKPNQPGLASPGLTRLAILRALVAGLREICLTKGALTRMQQSGCAAGAAATQGLQGPPAGAPVVAACKDMPVLAFAELHSSKALAKEWLLPAFSACSYAGDAATLSSTSYFPRAWLLQQRYGSLLRGAWNEGRASKPRSQPVRSDIDGSESDSTDRSSTAASFSSWSSRTGERLCAVEGCKAFSRGHEAVKRVSSEGAGIFSPSGGMRQLIEALEQHIVAPPPDIPQVAVVRGCRVVRLEARQAGNEKGVSEKIAEVVCADGSRYAADLVICAVHPYDLGTILEGCTDTGAASCMQPRGLMGRHERPTEGAGVRLGDRGSAPSRGSSMASVLLGLPCASWITVHAFGPHSSRRANSLGRGCFYATHQLDALGKGPLRKQMQRPEQHQPKCVLNSDSRKAAAAIRDAIQAAQAAMTVAELQLPGNLFPHSQAAALAEAGLFERAAAPWVSTPALLHAQATVRVHDVEYLLDHMQQLLLPLLRLLQPEGPCCEAEASAAGLRVLGLLISVAEEAVIRLLVREAITTAPDSLVLCSRLRLQAELQWPLTLNPTQGREHAAGRQRFANLLQQFEDLRDHQWSGSPALHAVSDDIPGAKSPQPSWLHLATLNDKTKVSQHLNEESSPPASFADGRVLFHQLRVQNAPWLQVVGPAGSFGEWGAGARVKDASILAHQVARRFAAFPRITPEVPADFIARLNGGWLDSRE